jgi:hypothetical protein
VTAATLSAATEVRRLRAELAEVTRQRDAMLRADDPLADAARRQVAEAAYCGGLADGIREGWAQSEADLAASWRAVTEPVAHPERGAARRIQAARAGERRDQAEHERAFVARAYNTAGRDRTDVQRATVRLYPPPGVKR